MFEELRREYERLAELINEIKWAERADKPIPSDVVNPDSWKKRCQEAKERLPETAQKIIEILENIKKIIGKTTPK